MVHIRNFVSEDDINYYKSKSNEEIKEMLYINKNLDNFSDEDKEFIKKFNFRRLYGLPEGNIDILLQQFREDGFTKYCRKGDWQYTGTKILNNDGTIDDFPTWTALFCYINKWDQESNFQYYKIITKRLDNKILWIGMENKNNYFISSNELVYSFEYKHKEINIFPNISEDEYFIEDDMSINDNLILKYKKNMWSYKYATIDKAKYILKEEKSGVNISLYKYFEPYFFYKGPRWNKNYSFMYGKDRTILISIQAKNNLFYIEIENFTHPFYGYFLLDLNEINIVEAKKIDVFNINVEQIYSSKEKKCNKKIFLEDTTRLYTQDEIDALLTVLHGSLINRIKIIKKRIVLNLKNIYYKRLVIFTKIFVYIVGIGCLKRELIGDSFYSYLIDEENNEE